MNRRIVLLLALLCAPLSAFAQSCPAIALPNAVGSARVILFGLFSYASGGVTPMTGVSAATANLTIALGSNSEGIIDTYTNGGTPDIDIPADPVVYVDPAGDVGFAEVGNGWYALHPDPDIFASPDATQLIFSVYESSSPTFLGALCSVDMDVVAAADQSQDTADATVSAMDANSTQLAALVAIAGKVFTFENDDGDACTFTISETDPKVTFVCTEAP
jgi:hypothetical protein